MYVTAVHHLILHTLLFKYYSSQIHEVRVQKYEVSKLTLLIYECKFN